MEDAGASVLARTVSLRASVPFQDLQFEDSELCMEGSREAFHHAIAALTSR
jgi:hypothetical protein